MKKIKNISRINWIKYFKNCHSFRILPDVSMKYCSMSIVKTLLMYRVCITERPREILQRLTDFWIKKNDILRLFECLELSESTACYQKSRCDRILLKRLSNPCRCEDMAPLFERNPTGLCWIFILDFLYQRHHCRLDSWDLFFVQPPYLQRDEDAVAGKGAPL